jgi:hypothetical protein
MFDVFFVLLILRAVVVTARGRSRAGLAGSCVALFVWMEIAAAGWLGHSPESVRVSGAWLLVTMGPSAMPAALERVPQMVARVVLAGALVAGFAAVWSDATRLSPLTDEAVRRKRMALAVLAPALLAAVQLACVALPSLMSWP